jgi:excisionase family DNA binding protein
VPEIAPDADLLTVPEAATVLKVSPVTVSRWLRQGRLPAYRLGPRAVRIRRADLAAVFSPARARPEQDAAPTQADPATEGTENHEPLVPLVARDERAGDATTVDERLRALAAAGALREQILARRKGVPVPPLEADRKRGKRS